MLGREDFNVIVLTPGVYYETLTIDRSGTKERPIVITGTLPNEDGHPATTERAVLDGTKEKVPKQDTGMVNIDGQAHILIKDLEIRNYKLDPKDRNLSLMGVFIQGASEYIQIHNTEIHNIGSLKDGKNRNAFGIGVFGTARKPIRGVEITHCEIHHLTLGGSESVALNGNVENFIIRDNSIHDNDNIGIDIIGFEDWVRKVNDIDEHLNQARNGLILRNKVYNIDTDKNINAVYKKGSRSAAGIYVDGGRNILIEQNFTYNNNIGIEIASEKKNRVASNIVVRNNFISHNHRGGIALGGYNSSKGGAKDCFILNNSFYNNDTDQESHGEIWMQHHIEDCTFLNNILQANSQAIFIGNHNKNCQFNYVDFNVYFMENGSKTIWIWDDIWYDDLESFRDREREIHDQYSQVIDPLFIGLNDNPPDLNTGKDSPVKGAGMGVFGLNSGIPVFENAGLLENTDIGGGIDMQKLSKS